jgi:hypothetical protein
MASMQEGRVGRSFEVPGTNEGEATENAWRAAEALGLELGVTLFAEQIEAGKWEVVLEDNGVAGSGIPRRDPSNPHIHGRSLDLCIHDEYEDSDRPKPFPPLPRS